MLRKISMIYTFSILSISFLTANIYSAQEKYIYDFSEPVTVVKAACKMLMNSDFEEMLIVTELNEKKITLETIDQIKLDNTLKEKIKKEGEKIESYEITSMEIYTNNISNQMVVVKTKWIVKVDNSNPKNPSEFVRIQESVDPDNARRRKYNSIVFVDYLLKKFEDKWKIISKRTR